MNHAGSLEVNVISAERLSFPMGTAGKNAFVVVGTTDSCNRQSTSTDRHGGAYTSWNQKLILPFEPGTRSLDVGVRCKTSLGEKTVGRSTIPITDFVGVYNVPCGYVHFLSYRLLDKDGKRNGIINLSVKVMTWFPESFSRSLAPPLSEPTVAVQETGGAVSGTPLWHPHHTFYQL